MIEKTMQPVSTRTQASQAAPAAQAPRPAKPESTRINAAQRNTFRMMLGTGATVAALVGAQAMAVLDRSSTATPVLSTLASASSVLSNSSTAPTSSINSGSRHHESDRGYNDAPNTNSTASNSAVQSSVTQPRPRTKSS